MSNLNGRFWLGTIPYVAPPSEPSGDAEQREREETSSWSPPDTAFPTELGLTYLKGQREIGAGGYEHWQIIAGFNRNVRLAHVKRALASPNGHFELTRSAAADEYVWKEETRVPGTQFSFGTKAIRRNKSKDWDAVLASAKSGKFDEIPADILVRCYSQISRIAKDHMDPAPIIRTCWCFWGATGTGKSRRAWDEAGFDAYPKDPSTKWFDGYRAHDAVIIDEFRGRIAIEHILRWLDRYPVLVETKGGATVFKASRIWITSNVDPRHWYPDANPESVAALLRRMQITHFSNITDLP